MENFDSDSISMKIHSRDPPQSFDRALSVPTSLDTVFDLNQRAIGETCHSVIIFKACGEGGCIHQNQTFWIFLILSKGQQ